ncbi:hypothetical protein Q7C36_008614 [Tachysurus vachellii]|uniref:Uncharacterized protein n=1 Tax=Tachysurus vachellii TaxID=175792 RepID=A0AA88N9J8_TACVA|nr:hypothetical protein Q7C36_008614 [Tachysurus vachellii]
MKQTFGDPEKGPEKHLWRANMMSFISYYTANLVASCAPKLHADPDSPTYCTEHSPEAVEWRPKQISKPCSTMSRIGRLTVLSSLQEPTGWLPVLDSLQRQMEQPPIQSSKPCAVMRLTSTELQISFTLSGSLQSPEADGTTSKAEL